MFHCKKCKKLSNPGEKSVLVVVEKRDVVYKDARGLIIGAGMETVKEELRCFPCSSEGVTNVG